MSSSASSASTTAHPPGTHLAHHFQTPAQQFEAAVQGMWLFLATEILLFGGLFCIYAVFRANNPEVFEYAHRYLSKSLGAINTVVLLCSSFTIAAGVRCAQLGRSRQSATLLGLTLLCGLVFLGIKYVEYQHKWKEGLLWGHHYRPEHEASTSLHAPPEAGTADTPTTASPLADPDAPLATAPAPTPTDPDAPSATFAPPALAPPGLRGATAPLPELTGAQRVHNVQTFFGVYFLMTGLHALHVLVGLGLIVWVALRTLGGAFSPLYFTPVAMVALYWHLVDLIWIYLFPLLYLIH